MQTSYSHKPCRYITGQEEIFALEKHYQGFYGSKNRGTSSMIADWGAAIPMKPD
jgi:hypothetical protein